LESKALALDLIGVQSFSFGFGFENMLTQSQILTLFQSQTIEPEWSFKDYSPSQTGKWSHSYHRYPAKFIPQLVEKLINEYVNFENAHINDPFMGSGTTIVTTLSRGFKASGVDINQMAYLITKVKATPIEPAYLDHQIKQFLARLSFLAQPDSLIKTATVHPLIPENHRERINYWFSESNQYELGQILRIIENQEDATIRDFLRVAFSHILKNCSIWLQGSTKPARDFKKVPAKPYQSLTKHLKKMQKANNEFYQVVPTIVRDNFSDYLTIFREDAAKQPIADNSVDLIISSSPYVTSYEYADLHQLSTLWLNLADDLADYRKCFIGTSHRSDDERSLKSQIAQDIVFQMTAKSKKLAKDIKTFFVDMQTVFEESFRILKPHGRCCYVIGNTTLRGINILNAQVFAESLQYAGFKLDRVIVREIPSKILPQKRDEKTGRFASSQTADTQAYPIEYIVIGIKE
jgi:DNA modification methylase